MVTVVYIDVLFAVNLILDYFILLAVSRVLRRRDARLRLFLGAVLGALYSLFIFFPEVNYLYSTLIKIAFSVLLVAVSFRIHSLREFLRLLIFFYLINFFFGGAVFACYLFLSPPGLLVRNGVIYLDVSPVVLILSAGACYVAASLVSRIFFRGRNSVLYDVTVETDGRTAAFRALVDTGNSLTDTITGLPILVAEYDAVKSLIPLSMRKVFESGKMAGDALSQGGAWENRLRMIPYGSLGNSGGLLPAFRPDRLTVKIPKEGHMQVQGLVAVSGARLTDDGRYSALLSPQMLASPARAGIPLLAGKRKHRQGQ